MYRREGDERDDKCNGGNSGRVTTDERNGGKMKNVIRWQESKERSGGKMTDVIAGKGQVQWRENGKQNGGKKMNTMAEK